MEYDEEGKSVFHKQIGSMGGKSAHKRAFQLNPELAKQAAAKGVAAKKKKREQRKNEVK